MHVAPKPRQEPEVRTLEASQTVITDALIAAAMSSARPRWRKASAVIEAAGRNRRKDDPAMRRGTGQPSEPSKL